MTVQTLGEVSIGDAVPLCFAVIQAQITALQPQITGLLEAQARLTLQPPTLTANLAAVGAILASISVAPPKLDIQLAAVAALLVKLEALIATLNVQMALLGASVSLYAYDGPAGGLGEFATVVPGGTPGAHCNGLLIATTSPAAWVSMRGVFQTGTL